MVDRQASTESPGTSHAQQAPGGGASRGPEFGTGGEPQVPVPPYDQLRGEPGENTAPAAFDASNAPGPGPTPSVSDEDRAGVSGTEVNPEPALGVGKSHRARGEDFASDDPDGVDTKGPSQRPYGTPEGEESDFAGTDES